MATIHPLVLIVAILVPGCVAQPTAVTADPSIAPLVQAARADAAKRSGLAPAALALVSAQAVTWSDGSLGCPRPGMGYTQALVPGYRVQLRVGGEVWNYHAGERGGPVLCPPGQSTEPLPGRLN